MIEQMDIEFPMVRNTDPASSHQAAEKHKEKLSTRRLQTLLLVAFNPAKTANELSVIWWNRYRLHESFIMIANTPNKRLPELEKLKLVFRTPELKTCSDSGYQAHGWCCTVEGHKELIKLYGDLTGQNAAELLHNLGDTNVKAG